MSNLLKIVFSSIISEMVPFIVLLVLLFPSGVLSDELILSEMEITSSQVLQLGKKMYRDGVLSSGQQMKSKSGVSSRVPGSAYSCESCHLRSGTWAGPIEGGIVVYPISGEKLYKPYYSGAERTLSERAALPNYISQYPPFRPAYSDESLAVAIREGVTPTGRVLDSYMPRYVLNDKEMSILIYYLKSLSSEYSPGVTETTISFATIITDDVSPDDRAAMLEPLENYVTARNNQAHIYATRAKYRANLSEAMDLSYRRLSLARWELKGPPETWRRQLEDYYLKEPVFALLGGISNREWKPIHDFSEEHGIPCLFPITDFPVISDSAWYTQYFSKGLYQEGEAAARYLAGLLQLSDKKVVQISDNSLAGKALLSGFQDAWKAVEGKPVSNLVIKDGETLSEKKLQELLNQESPVVLLLWIGSGQREALEVISENMKKPEAVFIASGQFKKNIWAIPEKAREFTFITYPYRLPQDEEKFKGYLEPLLKGKKVSNPDQKITARMYSLIRTLTPVFMHMRRNYYRDSFLDIIGMQDAKTYPAYEKIVLEGDQRYASKGCFIVQLSKGNKPELVKKSSWVVQ